MHTVVRSCAVMPKDNVWPTYLRMYFHCPVQKGGGPCAVIVLLDRVTSVCKDGLSPRETHCERRGNESNFLILQSKKCSAGNGF